MKSCSSALLVLPVPWPKNTRFVFELRTYMSEHVALDVRYTADMDRVAFNGDSSSTSDTAATNRASRRDGMYLVCLKSPQPGGNSWYI
jgi:hypothetical protein